MSNTWVDREKAYNELMRIMRQKVHREILTGRSGGTGGSQVEEVLVEDEGVDKEILDDGGGPHKKMGEEGGGGGGKGIEQCDGDGEGCDPAWRLMNMKKCLARRS